jgi:hypothetical protein
MKATKGPEGKAWKKILLGVVFPLGLSERFKALTKAQKIMLFVFVWFVLSVISSVSEKKDSSAVPATSDPKAQAAAVAKPIPVDLARLKVSFDVQDIFEQKQKIVVWVANNSEYIFDGNLSVQIKSKVDGRVVGSDYVFVEKLKPDQKTYAIVWSKPAYGYVITYDWSSTKFTEDTTRVKLPEPGPDAKKYTESGYTYSKYGELWRMLLVDTSITQKDFEGIFLYFHKTYPRDNATIFNSEEALIKYYNYYAKGAAYPQAYEHNHMGIINKMAGEWMFTGYYGYDDLKN